MALVSTERIKRMPGLNSGVSERRAKKIRDFAGRRGYYMPVVLSEADGLMTLLSGAVTFKACLEEKRLKVPAVIVQTEGDADNLMFALQSAELDETLDTVSVSAAIVQLIDVYGVTRKCIAETLNKSASWVNRIEGLSRKLNVSVQKMVAEGQISSRAAQEIARLPDCVQTPFAISAGNEFLSKDNVTHLVNRYLNEDTSREERDRIIHTPKLVLPNDLKGCNGRIKDLSDSARLSRAIARCLDGVSFLFGILERIDMKETTILMSDVVALAESLASLLMRVQTILALGKNDKGNDSEHIKPVNLGGGVAD
jgi:ParB-like chromosome segregation protein Spo0J